MTVTHPRGQEVNGPNGLQIPAGKLTFPQVMDQLDIEIKLNN